MDAREAFIDGVGLWARTLPGWEASHAALADDGVALPPAQTRPAPTLLAANERRRAPDAVLLALDVAQQATTMAACAISTLASVFTSAHGDLAITDALCRTLAGDAALLSPTRFHHSVHNAASGYWAIAAGSRAASTALAALAFSVAQGLLEALTQAAADETAVLLVASDTEAVGPLASTNTSRGLLAAAWVLAPHRTARSRWMLRWWCDDAAVPAPRASSAAAAPLAGNASALALPLLEALARGGSHTLAWPLSEHAALHLTVAALAE